MAFIGKENLPHNRPEWQLRGLRWNLEACQYLRQFDTSEAIANRLRHHKIALKYRARYHQLRKST